MANGLIGSDPLHEPTAALSADYRFPENSSFLSGHGSHRFLPRFYRGSFRPAGRRQVTCAGGKRVTLRRSNHSERSLGLARPERSRGCGSDARRILFERFFRNVRVAAGIGCHARVAAEVDRQEITDSRPPGPAGPCVWRRLPGTSGSRGRLSQRSEPCPGSAPLSSSHSMPPERRELAREIPECP